MRRTSLCRLSISILVTLGLGGCATLSPKQEGVITSDPPSATVYLYESVTDKRIHIGMTPATVWIKRGLWDMYIVAEKSGYESDRWLAPKSGSITHHFALQRDFASQIRDEVENYSTAYIKGVLEVIGKCDRVLNSPRMMASVAASEAQTELLKMRIEFPKYRNSAADRAMARAVKTADAVTSLSSSSYNTSCERNLALELQGLISNIQSGLDL